MDDSANKLSKQRRRRRILMHDDDDDSTPSKIQNLTESEPSFTTFSEVEKSTISSHTERTISSFSSTEQNETTSISKGTFSSSSEFEKSSFTSSGHADKQESSYESFSKSDARKVESYSDFTKTESTYRSYSRTDESSSVHKSSTSSRDLPGSLAGLSSIENLGGSEGIGSMRPKLGEIGKSDHTNSSLGSYSDFGRISRDDRDISIVDTGKSRTYHDKSTKEGHSEKSDKNSSEHRRFMTDSEKYSYSDKENKQVDYTRSEHHEVTERRGFVAPEEVMSILDRNSRTRDNTIGGRQSHDRDSLHSSGERETHTNIEDLLGRTKELSRETKEETKFKISHDVRSDEPKELSAMHVASIRDRVRLMRASMGNQFEEPEDVDQDHETAIDMRFSSDTATDGPAKEDQVSTAHEEHSVMLQMTSQTENEKAHANQRSESRKYDGRNIPNKSDQTDTEHKRVETETKTEHGVQQAYVNVAYDFAKPAKSKHQDVVESMKQDHTKNNTERRPFELETKNDLKPTDTVKQGISLAEMNTGDSFIDPDRNEQVLDRKIKPVQTDITDEIIQQDRDVVVHAEAPTGSEKESGKFSTGIKLMEMNTLRKIEEREKDHVEFPTCVTYSVQHDVEIEMVQQDEDQKGNVLEYKVPAMTAITTEEMIDIEQEAPARTIDTSDNLAEQQADHTHGIQLIESEITMTATVTTKYADEIPAMEVETGHETQTMPTDIGNNLPEQGANLTDGIQFMQTDISATDGKTPESEDEIQLTEGNVKHETPNIHTGDNLSELADSTEPHAEVELSNLKTDAIDFVAKSPNLDVVSGLLVRQSDTGNVSDEIITIQTGIVTSHEPNADLARSQQFGISPKTVGSDEVIIIHGVPIRPSHEIQPYKTLQHDTKLHKRTVTPSEIKTYHTQSYEVERREVQTYESRTYNIRLHDVSESSLNEQERHPEHQQVKEEVYQPHETPPSEIERSTENVNSSKFGAQKLNLRSYAPRPYFKPQAKLREKQPSNEFSFAIRDVQSTYLQSYEQSADVQPAKKLEYVKQPYETPPHDEEQDELMSYDPHTTLVQKKDNLHPRKPVPDVQPETKSEGIEQFYDTPPHEKEPDELMLYDLHPSEVQPKELSFEIREVRSTYLQPYEQPDDVQPEGESEVVKQPCETPPHQEPDVYDNPPSEEDTDELMSYELSPTDVQPKDNLQPYALPPDVQPAKKLGYVKQPYETPPHDEEQDELIPYDPHPTLVQKKDNLNVQPETKSEDIGQLYHTPPHENEPDELMLHDLRPSEVQPKDDQEDRSSYLETEEQTPAVQAGRKLEDVKQSYDTPPYEEEPDELMLYESHPTEERLNENLQPHEQPPDEQTSGSLTGSNSENIKQPYETPAHAGSDELRLYDPRPTEVQTKPEMIPADNLYHTEHYQYYDEERHEVRSYETTSYESRPDNTQPQKLQSFETPPTELQPQDIKNDMTQGDKLYTEPYDVEKPDDPSDGDELHGIQQHDSHLHDVQPEEMPLDKTDGYEEETHNVSTYKVILTDTEEIDIGPYQNQQQNEARQKLLHEQPLSVVLSHKTGPLKFQPPESRPLEPRTLEMQEFETEQNESQSEEEQRNKTGYDAVPIGNVPYAEEISIEESPEEKQTDEARQQSTEPLESPHIRPFKAALHPSADDLGPKPQPMDIDFENQSSVITRREVVTSKETTVHDLYSVNTSTEYETQYFGTDSVLDTSSPGVQLEQVTVEDTQLEPIYAEPNDVFSFEQILILDDLPEKEDSNDETNRKKIALNTEDVDILHSTKYKTMQTDENKRCQEQKEQPFGHIDKDSAMEVEHTAHYNVERREVRKYETIPSESRPYDLKPRELSSFKTHEPFEEQPRDKNDDVSPDLHHNEAYDVRRHEIRSYKTNSYERQQYEVQPPEPYKTQLYEIEPQLPDDNVYHTGPYDVERREVRPYKTTSYESQRYEVQPPESFETQSYEMKPEDKKSDVILDDNLYHTEPYVIEKREVRSYETTSYESRPYDDEFDDRPGEVGPLDSDEYLPQSNTKVDSILDSPTRKRKFPDSYEEQKDNDVDQSGAPHVAIKRKVRITTSNPFPKAGIRTIRKGGSKQIYVPLTSADEPRTNQIVEKISAGKRDVLESTQEQVDHVFSVMEYETADHKEQIRQKPRPQSEDESKHSRENELSIKPSSDPNPLRKYRVDCHIQLSPFERPESKRPLKSWKSEPILNLDLLEDDNLPKTRRWKSMNFEKKIPKQSSVVIALQKPQRRPLAPAYLIDNLPFETIIRNEVNIKLKKKRKKIHPSAKVLDDLYDDEPDGPSAREMQPREIQTEEIEREDIQLSESFETVDAFFTDNFNDEPEENPDDNKENEREESMESCEQSPLKRRNIEPTPLGEKKPRKSRLNITPVTIRPKSFKEEPTYVVVKQQQSSDITYGRVESAPSYKIHHGVTSEKPRDDIIIEETTSEYQNRTSTGFLKQQPHDGETFKEDRRERISDFKETTNRRTSANKDETRDDDKDFENELIQTQEQPVQSEPVRDLSKQPTPRRSTKRRHRIMLGDGNLEESVKNDELPVSPAMETPMLKDEPSEPNEEPKNVIPAVDVARYLEDDDNNNVPKDRYSVLYPNKITSPTEELHKTNQPQTFSQYPEDPKEALAETNVSVPSNETHDFPEKQESPFSIDIQQYLGHMVDDKVREKPEVNDLDHFEPYETYEANKEIQRLMEKVSDDEEEPMKPLVPQQSIEVILVDETKKKKKKKLKKQRDPNVDTISDDIIVDEPVANVSQLQEPATVEIKPVPEKKERVDTKEIAVQTMPVLDDMDSEDDSDQEILQYQQRSAIGGYLINTIPEEQEDESPLSTPDQNNFTPIDQEQIHRERGFLFRDTRDHEPTPRHPSKRTEKPTYSDTPVLPQKQFSEPTIEKDEAKSVELSPYVHDQSPQTREAHKTQKKQPNEHEKDLRMSRPGLTVYSSLSEPTDEKATEMSKPWQNDFPQVGQGEPYNIHSYQPPEDEKVGFEFDRAREALESSPTSSIEDLSETRYKPRFDIQDFVEEDKRRQNGVVIQAPPSKKHKMSSPHSPIDNTLLEGELYQREETIPVTEEPELVKPSYQPKYEVHDFIKQDVQKRLEPIKSTSTKDFVLEEEPYQYSGVDGQGDIRTPYQPKYQEGEDTQQPNSYVVQHEDELKPTQLDYQPRYEIRESIRHQQPKVGRPSEPLESAEPRTREGISEPIRPKYEPRFELIDMVAKENKVDEKPSYLEPVQTMEVPTVSIAQEGPEPLFYQPRYEIKNFVLEEEPGNADKEGDHEESDTDDSSFNDIPETTQPTYKPRYILDETPESKTQKVQPILEEKKDIPFESTRDEIIQSTYQPRYEITELRRKDEQKRQQYIEKDIPDGYQESIPSHQFNKEGPESIKPVYQPKYEIRDFVLEESPDEERQPVLDERVNTTAVPLVQQEPDIRGSPYQPRYKITDIVLEDQFEKKAKPIKPLRFKNRITAAVPFVEGEPGLVEERPEPEHISPVYQPQYEIGKFLLEGQMHKSEEPKLISEESPVMEEESKPTRSFRRPKFKVDDFLLEKEPQTYKPNYPVPDDKTDNSPVPVTGDDQESNRLFHVPNYEIKDSVLVDMPESKDQNEALALDEDPKRKQPKNEMSFVLEEEPESNEMPIYPTAATIVEKESEIKWHSYEPKYEIRDTLEKETAGKNRLFEPMESLYQPEYEIRNFVQEQPKESRAKEQPSEYPASDAKTTLAPVIQRAPDSRLTYAPKYKINDFVLVEEPESKPQQQQTLVSDQIVDVPSIPQSKQQTNFIVEEQPEKDRSTKHAVRDETISPASVPLVEEQPKPTYAIPRPKRVREFVLEEEPTKKNVRQEPESDENIQVTVVNNVQEEPEITRSFHQPKYEINDLVHDDEDQEPNRLEEDNMKRLPEHPVTDERVDVTQVSIVEKEPEYNYQALLPRKMREIVIEEEPKRELAPDEKENETPVNNLQDEPEITRSRHELKYEINDLVLEEQPENEDSPRFSEMDGYAKPATVPLVQEELEQNRSVYQTRYEIRDFVLEEHAEIGKQLQTKPADITESPLVEEGPEIKHPVYKPKEFEKETKYEIRDFVVEKHPQNNARPEYPVIDEKVNNAEVPIVETMVEEQPDFYRPFEPRHEVKAFVLNDGPLIERDHSKRQEKTKTDEVPIASNESDFTRSVNNPKYDIPDLETQNKIEFVIEEQPEPEGVPKHSATDETVETSTKSIVEEEPDFYRPFEPRNKVKAFVLDDGSLIERDQSKRQAKTKTDEVPVAFNEPDFTRSVNSPKYDIPDLETKNKVIEFVIEEQPEPEGDPKHSATDETVETSTESIVEEEPDFYRPFEPRNEVKAFVLDDGPLIERDQSKTKTDEVPVASNEPDFTTPVNSPKYDIPDLETKNKVIEFVIEEQPEPEGDPKHSATDETVETSTESIVEEEPDFYRPFEPRNEVKAFVLDDGPLIERDQSKTKTDEVLVASNEPDFTRSVNSLKYDIPDLETQNKVIEFVIEEQPEPEGIPKHSATDETVETSTESMVEEEPDFYRPFEPRNEVKAFVLDDGPLIERDQSKPQEKRKTDEVPLASNEPDFTRSVNNPKYDIPDLETQNKVIEFVIEEQPEPKGDPKHSATDETVETSTELMVEEEPDFYRPFEPRNEVKAFVLDDGPLIERDQSKSQEKTKTDEVPAASNEPDFTRPVNSPKYDIPDLETKNKVIEFVIEEQPEPKGVPKHSATDETVETSTESMVEEEPDFYRPFEPRNEVKAFVLDDGPLIERDQSKPQEKTKTDEVPVASNEPDFTRPVNSPKYDIPDLETKNKVLEFVIEEQPEPEGVPKHSATDETVETSTELMVEEEPDSYRPFEPRNEFEVKAFVLDDGPLIERDQSKPQEKTKTDEVPVSSKEPDFTRSVNSLKYDIPDLETQNKVIEFVIEEQPEPEGDPKHSATDETVETSTESMVEEEPDFNRSFEPRNEVKAFVLDDGPLIERDQSKPQEKRKTDEVPAASNEPDFTRSVNSPKYDIPDLETQNKVIEFVIEEQPEPKGDPKHSATDETVETSTESMVEEEPDFYRPFEPRNEFDLKAFVLDDGPLIERDQSKPQEKTKTDEVPVSSKEPDFTRSVNSPKYDIPDLETKNKVIEFVIEEQPEPKGDPKHSATDETVETSTELIVEEEPDFYRPFEPRNEVKAFALDDRPLIERDQSKRQEKIKTEEELVGLQELGIPTYLVTDELVNTSSVPVVEEEPEPTYSVSQPKKIREFVLEEEPENERPRELPFDENVNVTAVKLVHEKPNDSKSEDKPLEQGVKVSSPKEREHIRSLYQKTYELKDFVLIQESEQYETAVNPLNEENSKTTAVPLAEQEPVPFDVDLYQNIRPEKPLKDEGAQVQPNTLFVSLVGRTEPYEITVNVDGTSELIDESSQEETIIDDEPSRLDIDHADGDQSEKVGSDFIDNIRKMLSQRYEREEKTTVIIEEESTRKIKVSPLESMEQIGTRGILGIQEPEMDEYSVENVLDLENVENVDETTETDRADKKITLSIAADESGFEEKPVQIIENLRDGIPASDKHTEEIGNKNVYNYERELEITSIKTTPALDVDIEHFESESKSKTEEIAPQPRDETSQDTISTDIAIGREPDKPVGITIQLIDELPEPVKSKYDGTAEIKELVVGEPGHFKKRTIHTTTNTLARSEYRESEIITMTTSDFVENVPREMGEQRFVTEVDIPTSIVESVVSVNNEEGETERELISPYQTTGGITVDLVVHEHELTTTKTEKTTIENDFPSQLVKQSSLREVNVRPTAVDSTDGIMQEISGKGHESIEFEINNKSELMDQRHEMDKIHGETSIKKEPVTIYPLNRPKGITVQLIDDIPEPATLKYVGTAVIEKIVVDEPEHYKKRTIHTTTNTSARLEYYESEITNITTTDVVENIPPENAEQRLVREFEVDVPTTYKDGRPGMVNEVVLMNANEDSEDAAIHLAQDIPIPGNPESFSKTITRDEFEKVDIVNYEESEIITISSRTSSVDDAEDMTTNILPSYLTEVDPSALITTETARAKQEVNQLNEEPFGTIIIDSVENVEKKEERSVEIKTVTERHESGHGSGTISTLKPLDFGYDQEHIYARVNKEQLNIHDRTEESMKKSGESVIINHYPGTTTIATIDKNSLRDEETEKIVTEVEQKFVREMDNQNFPQEEISRSTDITIDASPIEIKQQDQEVVWMTVRQSKKLFDAGGSERVITLPIVNKLPSGNLSPTDNLDFDLENDGEMFAQRHKQESSGEYHTSTRAMELEKVEEIPVTEREEPLEHSPDYTITDENVLMELRKVVKRGSARSSASSKHSQDLNLSRTPTAESDVMGSEEISRRSVRETLPVADGTTTESNVWCTVKLKRWESDIRGVNLSKQSRGDTSELSSSIASIDGSYERDTPRGQSPNSEFCMESESTNPWISVRRKHNEDMTVYAFGNKSNKDSKIVKRSSSRSTTYHGDGESIGYSMHITATDDGPLMTQEDTFSTVETESTQSTNMGDVKTLPWIEVRKRNSIRQRLSFKKKKHHASLKNVSHATDGEDRLLLLKIPRTMLQEMENNENMLDTEVEIPWMELDQSTGETQGLLPWVELADQNQHSQTDRILMLKISRDMILKASKESTGEESEIQLPWNEVVRYWEETGQITPGSLSRPERPGSANIAITFPRESTSESQLLEENPNLPNMRLILPKKCCLDGSLRFKPMITVNEKRNIKVRINKTVKRKHDWNTLLRLSNSERRKKYSHATEQDDWVVLADGTKWWRLQVDDMDEFNKLQPRSDGQKFENCFEISSEDTDERESIDFNEFTKELGTKKQKQFSFVIDPKNFLTSSMSF